MKPIIIFVQKDENGNICMSAEKFEKYIQTAYESGVEDGKSRPLTGIRGEYISGGAINVREAKNYELCAQSAEESAHRSASF